MSEEATYSRLDRALHRIAFKGIGMQKALADIEDRLFSSRFEDIAAGRPVFVTSLPRAGTTLLLEVLVAIPDFASHTYRDMPFLLCPLLWDRISRGMRKEAALRERAHGDGMAVGYDSPEAFEEVLWSSFWRQKYLSDRIVPWSAEERFPEFEQFFARHMRKIIALRSSGENGQGRRRYISKNNANIARLELLTRIFPDCQFLIPVRNPWDHVGSLMRQHDRFSELHAKDAFARQYMEWLGHFEFGATLRPIDFQHWRDKEPSLAPEHNAYWLAYWVYAYESAMEQAGPNVHFVDYDRLCAEPRPQLEKIAAVLQVDNPAMLAAQASRFRRPTEYRRSAEPVAEAADARLTRVYEALKERAL